MTIKFLEMKKISLIVLVLYSALMMAQNSNANYEMGKGLTFDLNEGQYEFFIGGFIQPIVRLETVDGIDGTDYFFNSRRSFFMLGGKALKEKFSFLVQTDFSSRSPLLDAWVAYHPYEWLTISAGQKQNFVNNREMLYREDRLQFTDRSLSSRNFSRTGREFGLFVETSFGENFIIAPKASITSGDGKNSFGADSRDTDLGGIKYGGRLDIYPNGAFKPGNDLYTADLLKEDEPKFLIGTALSKNKGASEAVGEGHGDFLLFDENGNQSLPDYNQFYTDLLVKYKGFSMLFEYSNATASNIDKVFVDQNALNILAPTQISQFLVLGNSYVTQIGYVTKHMYGFDVRYEVANREFETANSVLSDFTNWTFGFSKYFNQNNLKLQVAYNATKLNETLKTNSVELLLQISF